MFRDTSSQLKLNERQSKKAHKKSLSRVNAEWRAWKVGTKFLMAVIYAKRLGEEKRFSFLTLLEAFFVSFQGVFVSKCASVREREKSSHFSGPQGYSGDIKSSSWTHSLYLCGKLFAGKKGGAFFVESIFGYMPPSRNIYCLVMEQKWHQRHNIDAI